MLFLVVLVIFQKIPVILLKRADVSSGYCLLNTHHPTTNTRRVSTPETATLSQSGIAKDLFLGVIETLGSIIVVVVSTTVG